MARFSLVLVGLLSVSLCSGCRERNPAYMEKVDAGDGPQAQPDTKVDPIGGDAPVADARDAAPDQQPADSPPVSGPEVGLDGALAEVPPFGLDTGAEGPLRPETGTSVEVGPEIRPETGDPSDGARERGNGDGGGGNRDAGDAPLLDDGGSDLAGEDGGDAADLAPICPEPPVRPCASPGNPLVGVCTMGQQTCSNGLWQTACVDEVLPAEHEVCDNGLDDNCNGLTNEGCVDGCVVVAPSGDDATADGSPALPFATLAKALAFAGSADGGSPRPVCVAGGATCEVGSGIYDLEASLAIPNGARVQGNYALAGSVLSYCAGTQPPTTTIRLKAATASLVFAGTGPARTELGGFSIERTSATAATDEAVTAVTVDGARNVVLSGLFITDAPTGDTTYGVVVKGGGQASIVRSAIVGGLGKVAAIGVYVDGGSVYLRDNCDPERLSGGSCQARCEDTTSVLGIRGRAASGAAEGDASAVYLTDQSTGASSIAASLLCSGPGAGTSESRGANVAALRCSGSGCDVVSGNAIAGGTGKLTVAVALVNGGGRLQANAITGGCGSEGATGVLLNASPASLYNNRILGGACGTAAATANLVYGVRVVHTTGNAEPILHSNTIDPRGHGGECESRGISFERVSGQAASTGVLRNNIVAAGNCKKRTAVYEDQGTSARVLESNDLYPGPVTPSEGTTILLRRSGNDLVAIDKVNALPGAAANASADPKYASYPDDLHLTAASTACIDKGTAAGAPSTDGDGVARPQGVGFDIGAYEYVTP